MANLLDDLVNAIRGKSSVSMNSVPSKGNGQTLTAQNQQQINATIAADGAKMYQQAHPGQTYTPGQNGEKYPGGIDMNFYNGLMSGKVNPYTRQAPAAAARGNAAQLVQGPQQGIQVAGVPLRNLSVNLGPQGQNLPQGTPYNPGLIPLQGSRGPVQPQMSAYNSPQQMTASPQNGYAIGGF